MLWFECSARSKARAALAALFCACLSGCTGQPVETDQPSYSKPAVEFCNRKPESVLCPQ